MVRMTKMEGSGMGVRRNACGLPSILPLTTICPRLLIPTADNSSHPELRFTKLFKSCIGPLLLYRKRDSLSPVAS
jgi:hypothetical protein